MTLARCVRFADFCGPWRAGQDQLLLAFLLVVNPVAQFLNQAAHSTFPLASLPRQAANPPCQAFNELFCQVSIQTCINKSIHRSLFCLVPFDSQFSSCWSTAALTADLP